MAYRSYRTTVDFGFGYGITPAVKKLLIANVAAFVLMVVVRAAGYGSAIRWLMLTPFAVTHNFALWQLVTYLFLHAGFFHILFNMLALWMFGGELERTWGARRFLFYYFLTGIGAGLTVVLVNPFSGVATLGASGAIYGILLAYGLLFPDRPIFLWFLFPIPAKYFVMIMGGIEFLSQLSVPGDTVSHMAHLGGLAVGYLYLRGRPRYFDLRNRYYRWRRQRTQRQFQVYMNKREREERRHDRWIH
jgi:membrane associated rhomboid family serine protease